MVKRGITAAMVLTITAALAACDTGSSTDRKSIETLAGSNVVRHHDPQKVALGARVYQQHCAVCHGAEGEGAPTWRQRDADGFYPPPPLNGTGHEWHHSKAALREIILDGTPPGQGKMPAWRSKLTNEEIDAVIEWFQSKWPDPVYAAWFDMEQRSFGR